MKQQNRKLIPNKSNINTITHDPKNPSISFAGAVKTNMNKDPTKSQTPNLNHQPSKQVSTTISYEPINIDELTVPIKSSIKGRTAAGGSIHVINQNEVNTAILDQLNQISFKLDMIQQDFEFTQQRVSNIKKILQIEVLTPQEAEARSQANEENMLQYIVINEQPNLPPIQPKINFQAKAFNYHKEQIVRLHAENVQLNQKVDDYV